MYNSGYMGRGGCATCGISNNNYRSSNSPEYNYNRYTNNSLNNSNNDFYQNSYNNSYNDSLQRILTPPRNYSYLNINNDYSTLNVNNYQRYDSPARNIECRSCSISPSKDYNDSNYQRPNTNNLLKRNTNIYNVNYNNNSYNLKNTGYNFRKRYNDNNNNSNENILENTYNPNRYYAPLRNPQRGLVNSFSNPNLLNNSNIHYQNYVNRFNNNNDENRNYYDNNKNNYNSVNTSLDKRYRKFLEDNLKKYNYSNNNNYNKNNYNKNKNNNSNYNKNSYNKNKNNNNNYNKVERKNNYTTLNRSRSILMNNNRGNYSKYNNYLSSNERVDDKFIKLNIYNYQRKIREMIQKRKTFFIFIYGSHDYTGQSWCSDCNTAMPNVEQVKNKIRNNNDREIYFIDIPIDKINMKDLANDGIIQLERVPTLIYFDYGMERDRLVETELFSYQAVNNFILQAYDSYKLSRNNLLYQRRNYY